MVSLISALHLGDLALGELCVTESVSALLGF